MFNLLIFLFAIAIFGYFLGRAKARKLELEKGKKNHSLPVYYGQFVGLFALVLVSPEVVAQSSSDLILGETKRVAEAIDRVVQAGIKNEEQIANLQLSSRELRDLFAEVGVGLAGDVHPSVFTAAQNYRKANNFGFTIMVFLAIAISLLLAIICFRNVCVSHLNCLLLSSNPHHSRHCFFAAWQCGSFLFIAPMAGLLFWSGLEPSIPWRF